MFDAAPYQRQFRHGCRWRGHLPRPAGRADRPDAFRQRDRFRGWLDAQFFVEHGLAAFENLPRGYTVSSQVVRFHQMPVGGLIKGRARRPLYSGLHRLGIFSAFQLPPAQAFVNSFETLVPHFSLHRRPGIKFGRIGQGKPLQKLAPICRQRGLPGFGPGPLVNCRLNPLQVELKGALKIKGNVPPLNE